MNARGIPTATYQVLHLLTEVGYPPSGYPLSRSAGGVPEVGYPPLGYPPPSGYPPPLGYLPCWGTPRSGYPPQGTPQSGYPPVRVPPIRVPPAWTWLGYPPAWTWLRYPPPPPGPDSGTPPPRCGQTDRWMDGWMDRHVSKHYLPVVLCTRSVKIQNFGFKIMTTCLFNTICELCTRAWLGVFLAETK